MRRRATAAREKEWLVLVVISYFAPASGPDAPVRNNGRSALVGARARRCSPLACDGGAAGEPRRDVNGDLTFKSISLYAPQLLLAYAQWLTEQANCMREGDAIREPRHRALLPRYKRRPAYVLLNKSTVSVGKEALDKHPSLKRNGVYFAPPLPFLTLEPATKTGGRSF